MFRSAGFEGGAMAGWDTYEAAVQVWWCWASFEEQEQFATVLHMVVSFPELH
jgi:hypothetical protein